MKYLPSSIRTWYYIFKYQYLYKKAAFGKGVRIDCKLVIRGPGQVGIGDHCIFEPTPWGDEYVTIYTHQPNAQVVIGKNVLLRATRFGSHLGIRVLDGAVLENASVFDSDFHNTDANKRDQGFNAGDRPVTIGARAYVGCESLCSKGTCLGDEAVLLPVSVVGTKKVPVGAVFAGFPAQRVR